MRGTTYQYSLISFGVLSLLLFGIFFYREMFPEYMIYQNDYIAIENFRSTYTHESAPVFKTGIKQLLLERSDKGNPIIDRCISCHVALEFPHFSPTKIDYDQQGKPRVDSNGFPLKMKNENYIWDKIDQKIAELEDITLNAQLEKQGDHQLVQKNLSEAHELRALKIVHVGENTFDVTKVLAMHPLMGKETRPFEFHPTGEYGCSSCHSGNGRGITTLTAHGPFLDDQFEKEDMGETPLFTEVDQENDPRFSRIFNGKPGHALLFQTTPILVGALIQAKCMQCHLSNSKALANAIDVIDHITPEDDNSDFKMHLKDIQELSAKHSDIDLLTGNYHRGEELFIEQACYACHRISGFARGGVGPELSQSGESYPWYIKESVVWPQADLHTSTMPNFVLDHEELEDLITFLLGQTGKNQAVAQTSQKSAIQQWEAGQKLILEKPISPVQMQDTRYAMTVFASEGCAACHRLTGFDSNVGFKIEKDATPPTFAALQEEKEWFRKLIPEQIMGSTLAKVVEEHAKEIDTRIANDVRKNGLLDELEKTYPKLIETFYTPFKFAARAKNAHFKALADAEIDPAKKAEIAKEAKAWKKRLHDLMFIYAQEYGLGRLIGPRPNWSGIFRSDEWLMEHFKNPSAHVPRSIMPVFPFDETKFYALTLMLDTLALKNRNATRTIWQNQGFNPEMAYNLYCAQCHGDFLQGNGPVAPWIYPIPKNLNNAEFLRNLTRERVIDSIKFGIKGTPMPPWGEAALGKTDENISPVLTDSEIESMTNWLFSSLPGGHVIRGAEDVLKWNYSPEEVLKELHKEGNLDKLKDNKTKESLDNEITHSRVEYQIHDDIFCALPRGNGLLASLTPLVTIHKDEVTTLFDVVANPLSHPDLQSYYIKKKYYTPENIEEGQRFFEINCAACHGKDADGSGLRSSTMSEAKPRMLTNVDWIKTRDDLRLLRSIKFGVPGTSMSPWGDLTSSLQRLQLVMFIRSLSEERSMREQLAEVTYKTFDATEFLIERARKQTFSTLIETQKAYSENKSNIKNLINEIKNSSENGAQLFILYEKENSLKKSIKQLQQQDAAFLDLKSVIKEEQRLYNSLGLAFIQIKDSEMLKKWLNLIDSLSQRFKFDGNYLTYEFSKSQELEFAKATESINEALEKKIKNLEKEAVITEKKNSDPEDLALQLNELRTELTAYTKIKNKLASIEASTDLLRQKKQLHIPLINPTIPKSDSQNG